MKSEYNLMQIWWFKMLSRVIQFDFGLGLTELKGTVYNP